MPRFAGWFAYNSPADAQTARDWLVDTWVPAHAAQGSSGVGPLGEGAEAEGCAADSQLDLDYTFTDQGAQVEVYEAIDEGGTVVSACSQATGVFGR